MKGMNVSNSNAPRPSVLVAVLALVAGSSSCHGPRVEAETLPFHVAVVPFSVHETERPLSSGETRGKILLEFEGEELAEEYARVLDGLSFTQVSRLEPPHDVDAQEFAAWPEERRAGHWVAAAQAAGADLLFVGDLVVDPRVETTVVTSALWGAFWEGLLKLGVYSSYTPQGAILAATITVLGWDGEERAHRLHARLDSALLDPGQLAPPGGIDLANRRTQLVRSFRYETYVETSFHRRQNWFGHFLSFFVPGALFPSDQDVLARSLREQIGTQLLRQLVLDVEFQKGTLLEGAELFPFRVERLTLERVGTYGRLACRLELDTRSLERMDGYRVWIDGRLAQEGEFAAPVAQGEASARYDLALELPDLPPEALVRLELRDDAPRQHARTFTLRAGRTGQRVVGKLALELPAK